MRINQNAKNISLYKNVFNSLNKLLYKDKMLRKHRVVHYLEKTAFFFEIAKTVSRDVPH
jgi:hypothetical protein